MPVTPTTATPPARSTHPAFVASTAVAQNTIQSASLEVYVHAGATAGLYFTFGQSVDPAVGADGTFYLDPGQGIKFEGGSAPSPLRAISAGAGTYSVTW
jgi:hypothetical protein